MKTTRLAWHHLLFEVPSTWEVIAYNRNPLEGQLVLADRNGETMQVFWKRLPKQPALTQRLITVVNAHAKDPLSDSTIRRQIRDVRGWPTYIPDDPSQAVFAVFSPPEEHVLLHVVFPPHPATRDRSVIRSILSSFQPNPPSKPRDADCVWAVFGLDVTLPREYELETVTPVLASQVMRFENRRGESVTIHRYGMLQAILSGQNMETFFARVKGKRFLLYREGDFRKDDRYPGIRLSYHTRGRGGFDVFLAPTWQGKVWVWRCDDVQRLYCVDNNALEEHLIPDLPDRIRCQ